MVGQLIKNARDQSMFPSPAPHSTPSTSGDIQLLSFWDWPLTSVMSQLGKGPSILAPLH